jgi:hypothetical protein
MNKFHNGVKIKSERLEKCIFSNMLNHVCLAKNNHACAKNVNSICDNKMEAYSILLLFHMFTLIRKSRNRIRQYRKKIQSARQRIRNFVRTRHALFAQHSIFPNKWQIVLLSAFVANFHKVAAIFKSTGRAFLKVVSVFCSFSLNLSVSNLNTWSSLSNHNQRGPERCRSTKIWWFPMMW